MKLSARLICVLAWVFAGVVQLVFVLQVPDKIVIAGTDLSQANAMVRMHQAVFIGIGLLVAALGYVVKKWSSWLVIVSSALYLVHWFPLQSVQKYGLIAVSKNMWMVGSTPGLTLTSVARDAVLPIMFCASIVLALLEMRRPRVSAATSARSGC
jgi:hypothetical protein